MISDFTLRILMETAVLAFSVPVVALAVWKMRTRKSLVPFFIGMLTFFVFVRVLEGLPHMLFIMTDNPISRLINGNVVLYSVYGALTAALFEEAGRFVAYKFFLTKHTSKETAVTYGLGHGGFECMLVLGFTYLNYYMYAQFINNGTINTIISSAQKSGESTASIENIVETIKSITYSTCLFAGWERISAMLLQVALSILVFQAVRIAGKRHMLWIAMLLHFVADLPAGFYQFGLLPIAVTEAIIFGIALAVFLYSIMLYKNMDTEEEKKLREATSAQKHNLHKLANQRVKDINKD